MDIGAIAFGIVFIASGVYIMRNSPKKFRRWRKLGENDPVAIRDATTESDLVEIEGRARPHEATLESPYFDVDCVAYKHKTEKKVRRKSSSSSSSKSRTKWKTIDSGKASRPFVVEDDSGTAYVDPDSASFSFASDQRRTKNTRGDSSPLGSTLGKAISAAGPALGSLGFSRRRYTEQRLDIDSQCYVAGAAERPPAGVDADVSLTGTDVSTFVVSDTTEAKTRLRLLLSGLKSVVWGLIFVIPGLAVLLGFI